MQKINWHQVKIGGCPALLAALQEWERQSQAEMCELVDRVAQLTERVEQLECLLTEEIMAGLARPAELREVVAELGAGWRIERSRGETGNANGVVSEKPAGSREGIIVTADSWLVDDWVTQYVTAVEGK